MRVPLGVVAVVYEARPNVTIDCSALCLKSGNAIVLRGSSTAANSNAALAQVAATAIASVGVPAAAISIVTGGDRDELRQIATQDGVVDLVIPRGGDGLKNALKEHATVPVMYAAGGNCHVYVDAAADLDDALAIALNAKVQRPSVCNAAETLLVHARRRRDVPAARARRAARVGRRAARRRAHARDAGSLADSLADGDRGGLGDRVPRADPGREGRRLRRRGDRARQPLQLRPLRGGRDRLAPVARAFTDQVDAACVYVNASTRFTDGAVFGMGAEIGNSTQKLHARGPVGMRELTTYKYVVEGSGQVRT